MRRVAIIVCSLVLVAVAWEVGGWLAVSSEEVQPQRPPDIHAEASSPPAPPPVEGPPPVPWTGLWKSENGKATIRLSDSPKGWVGYYSAPNPAMRPGAIERVMASDDSLVFTVVLGQHRFGVRMERDDRVARVSKWLDFDGLMEEYAIVDQAAGMRRINAFQANSFRQQLKDMMKTAGPEHAEWLGEFSHEYAPPALPTRR